MFRLRKSIILFLSVFIFIMLITNIRISTIYGISMEPSIRNDDIAFYIRSNKLNRFDIVSIYPPNANKNITNPFIKRVIAFENETIEVVNGIIYINGEEFIQNFKTKSSNLLNIKKTIVPKGKIYVLGDNRLKSLDSEELGCFDLGDLQGRLIFKLSINKIKPL